MADHTPEHRLATIEQVLRDMRKDIDDLQRERREDHHRLRNVNAVTDQLAYVQNEERRERENQFRRIGVRIQWLMLGLGIVGVLVTAALGLLAALR